MDEKGYYTRDFVYLCYQNGIPFITDDIALALKYKISPELITVEFKTLEPDQQKCFAIPNFD